MKPTKLNDYLLRHPYAEKVISINKPHQLINFDYPIEVYTELIYISKDATRFLLFANGELITNVIQFPCEVEPKDIYQISKNMIDEYISSSDFEDLNKELAGSCACDRYSYKSCDECPEYKNKECMGATYSMPHHKNSWDTQDKWDEIYGRETENYKNYRYKQLDSTVKDYMIEFRKDRKMLKKLKKLL